MSSSDYPILGVSGMILEGLVTTQNPDGTVNIAPMGPLVDNPMDRILLRPFRSSATYHNLKRDGKGVFHVTDDVELIARAAVGSVSLAATCFDMERPLVLADACRWYEFAVDSADESQERTSFYARITSHGVTREFCGFNRAKHAVLEAAILATRLDFLPATEVRQEMNRLAPLVAKTGGAAEHRAWQFLGEHVERTLSAKQEEVAFS